jgi:protoheme IX farnesyltransferase
MGTTSRRENTMKSTYFAAYAWGVLLYHAGIILTGAYLRSASGEAACASPALRCAGEGLPIVAHLYGGGALLLVLGLLFWSIRRYQSGEAIRRVAWFALGFALLQRLLPGLALLAPQVFDMAELQAAWTLLYLTSMLLLLASLALCAWWATGNAIIQAPPGGMTAGALLGALLGMVVLSASSGFTLPGASLGAAILPAVGLTYDVPAEVPLLQHLRFLQPALSVMVSLYLAWMAWMLYQHTMTATLRKLAGVLTLLASLEMGMGMLTLALQGTPLQLPHVLLHLLLWVVVVLLASEALAWPLSHRELASQTAPMTYGVHSRT